jgi:hypothetical protein
LLTLSHKHQVHAMRVRMIMQCTYSVRNVRKYSMGIA